jgi:outer membrane cobalamin receptor
VNAGLRWDYDQRASEQALSPRSAVGITPWEQGRLKLIYSQAFRAPSAYEIEYANPTYQIRPSGLSAETVRSVEGSLEQRFGTQRVLIGGFRSWWRDMVSLTALDAQELATAMAAGQLDGSATEAYQYRNLAKIQNYGINAAFEGSLLGERLRYGLNLTDAVSRVDEGDGNSHALTVGPSLFGNARVAYDFSEPWPTLGLAAQYLGRRPADRAFDGGFARTPYAPAHVELRLTASGQTPFLSGLGYRLIGDYAFAKQAPYVIGPNQYAADASTPYELAPVRRTQLFLELNYQFDP